MIHPRDMRSGRFTIKAPGKINLFLEVFGRRPDGYHDVKSLLAHVSLCDVLTLERTSGPIKTTMEFGDIPLWSGLGQPLANKDNLATRSAMALRKATGYRGGARIHVAKHIPICGGLGGGSADAAATLRGLNRLWQTGLTTEDLCVIASKLGSDVPAMVHGGMVLLEGMGEIVEPVPVDRTRAGAGRDVVIVNPGFRVSTRDICDRYRYKRSLTSARGQFRRMVRAAEKQDIETISRGLFNSLERIVFKKYPLIEVISEGLKKAGARGVLLSGSGASVFALADSKRHAGAIAAEIGRAMGPWLWVRVAKILPDGVTAAHGPLEARV